MSMEKDIAVLQTKMTRVEENLNELVSFNRELQQAVLENTRAATSLSKRLDSLVSELHEPLESFKTKKYAFMFIKQLMTDGKVYLAIGIGFVLMVIFNNFGLVTHLLGKL